MANIRRNCFQLILASISAFSCRRGICPCQRIIFELDRCDQLLGPNSNELYINKRAQYLREVGKNGQRYIKTDLPGDTYAFTNYSSLLLLFDSSIILKILANTFGACRRIIDSIFLQALS